MHFSLGIDNRNFLCKKKNKLVIAICIVTGILHLVWFYVIWFYSDRSLYPVFDWFVEALTFGLIKLPGGWR